MGQVAVLGASAAFERHSQAAHQKKAFEAVQVRVASSQDVAACCFEVVYGFEEAEIGFVGMEEAENRRMGHSESSEARLGTEVGARLETVVDHLETDSMARSEMEALHSGTVKVHFGMEDRSGTEEAVRFETGTESRGRSAGEIAEVAQMLDFEVDQTLVAAGGMETAVAEKAVAAEHMVEERQSKTSFEAELRMGFAVAAVVEGSLASQPCPNLLVTVSSMRSSNDLHSCQDSDSSLGSDCHAPCH